MSLLASTRLLFSRSLFAAALLILINPAAQAVTYTWSGTTDSSWSSGGVGGNWSGSAAPGASITDLVLFNSTSTANLNTVIGATNYSIGTIQIGDGGGSPSGPVSISGTGMVTLNATLGIDMSLASQGLTITGPLTVASVGNQTWNVGSGVTLNVGAVTLSAATTGLDFNGAGNTIFNGVLTQTANATLTNSGTGTVTYQSFTRSTFNTVFDGTGNHTVTGNIAGGGNVTRSGTGTLSLSGVNSYTGGTIANAGTILFNGYAAVPTSGTLTINGGSISLLFDGGTGAALVNGNGTGQPQNVNFALPVSVTTSGGLTVGRLGSTYAPNFPLAANKSAQLSTLTITGSQNFTVTNNNGYGVEFLGTATFTGAAPTLTVQNATSTGLGIVQGLAFTGAINAASGFTKAGDGTMVLKADNSATLIGDLTVTGGVLAATQDTAFGTPGNGIILNGSTSAALGAYGSFSTSRNITFTNGTNTANQIYVSAGNTLTLNSVLTGTNGFQKNDPGVLVMNANNSAFSGAISLASGVLRVSNTDGLGTGVLTFNTLLASTATVAANTGTALQINGVSLANATGTIVISGTGVNSGGALQNISGSNTVANVQLNFAGFIGADAGTTLTLGNVNYGANTLTLIGEGNGVINGFTTSTGILAKNGTGAWNLTGGTFTGGLQILNGSLTFSNAATYTGIGTPVISAAGTLILDNSATNTNNRLNGRLSNMWFGGELRILGNAGTDTLETTGGAANFTPSGSAGTITLVPDINTATVFGAATTFPISRAFSNNSAPTLLIRGTNLGDPQGPGVATVRFSNVTFTGQQGVAGTSIRGILPWIIVDPTSTGTGTAFATYDSTIGFRALGQVPGETVGTLVANSNIAPTSALTASSGTFTVNSLSFGSGGSLNLTNASTFQVDSGGILSSAVASISGGAYSTLGSTSAKEVIFQTLGSSTLTVGTALTGTSGFTKAGTGTLELTTRSFITGGTNSTTVNNGVLKLSAGTNTLFPSQLLSLNYGGTLDLNGNSQLVGTFQSPATGGNEAVQAGGILINTSATPATFVTNMVAAATFAGQITGNNLYFAKYGASTLTLTKDSNFTGTFVAAGTTGSGVTLTDFGRLSGVSAINIFGGVMTVSNTGLTNLTDRINDAAPITLRGGTLIYQGRQQTNSTESIGVVTITGGANTITNTTGGGGVNSSILTIADLVRTNPDAVFLNQGASGAIGSTGRTIITTRETTPGLTNYIVGAWALGGASDFLSYVPGLGLANLTNAGFPGATTLTMPGVSDVTSNVRLSASASLPTGGLNANTFTVLVGADISFVNSTDVLNLTAGGLLKGIASGGFTNISVTPDFGRLTAGGPSAVGLQRLFIHHSLGTVGVNDFVMNARIVDNGTAPVRLILNSYSGGAIQILGANTYTGGTVINGWPQNGAVVTLGASGVIPAGGITLNQRTTLNQVLGGLIDPSNVVTINGNGVVNLVGNNTLAGVVFDNYGGSSLTPTVSTSGVLTLGVGGIVATSANPSVTPSISGTGFLDLGGGSQTMNVAPVTINGVSNIAPLTPSLNLGIIVQNGSINKTGAGILQLSSQNIFTGGVNLTAGSVLLAASSTLTAGVLSSGPLGTGTLIAANDTSILAGAAQTIANNLVIQGNLNFAGLGNITFYGNTTLPLTPLTIDVQGPQQTIALIGPLTNPTTNITKTGYGTLAIGGSYAGTLSLPSGGGIGFLNDGDGTGSVQNLSAGTVSTGGALTVTVGRTGVTYAPYFATASNKNIQVNGLNMNGFGLSVTNNNGYGLELLANQTLGAATQLYSVGTATASNLTQGLTVSGVISGSVGIQKLGAGALVLGNTGNTFGGAGQSVEIAGGIVAAGSDGALGNTANGVVINVNSATGAGFRAAGTFTTARTFKFNQLNNAIEVTTGNTLTITSPFVLASPTSQLIKNDNGILELAADNSGTGWTGSITAVGASAQVLTGGVLVNAGIVRIRNANALGSPSNIIAVNNGGIAAGSGAAVQISDGITVPNPLVLSTQTSNAYAGGVNWSGGLQSIGNGQTNTWSGPISENQDSGITATAGNILNITGGINFNAHVVVFGGAGNINVTSGGLTSIHSLDKVGSGTLTIGAAAANPTGNGVRIFAGTLVLNNSGVFSGAGTILTNILPGATLTLDNTTTAANNRLGSRAITFTGGNLNLVGNASTAVTETTLAPSFVRGQTTITVTDNGAGTNLRFGAASNNVAPVQTTGGTGSTVLFRGTNLGTAAGVGIASVASSSGGILVNGQTGATGTTNKSILPWAIIDTTATGLGFSFATADTAAAAANTGTAILRPLAANEYASGALTANNNMLVTTALTAQPTVAPNSLTFDTGGSIALGTTGGVGNTVTLSSGGILVRNGITTTISGGVMSQPAANSGWNIHTVGTSSLTISSQMNGGQSTANMGLVKAGGGTLTLSTPTSTIPALSGFSANTLLMQSVVNQGTLRLNGGTNTLGTNNYLEVGAGGTLDLNGNSQYVLGLYTDGTYNGMPGDVTAGGTVTSTTAATLVVNSDARNWAGQITGNVFYNRTGSNSVTTIYTPQTYTAGTLINGGTVSLRDYAALTNTSAINVQYGILQLDNTASPTGSATDLSGRLNTAATITLRGGLFLYLGRVQTASAETVGPISLVDGWNVINSRAGGTGINSAVLTAASLTRPTGASGVFHFGNQNGGVEANGQIGSTARFALTTTPTLSNNLIGPWAIVSREWASYIPGLGVGQLNTTGYAGYAALGTANSFAGMLPTDNIRFTGTSVIPTGNVTINTLNLNAAATNTIDLGGFQLTLAGGGLMNATSNISTVSFQNGTITSGYANGAVNDLYIHHLPYAGSSRFMVLNAGVVNNGATPVRLVMSSSELATQTLTVASAVQGTNVTVINGTNTYTGGTVFNGGTHIVANGANLPSGGVTLNGATLGEAFGNVVGSANVAGSIDAANVVTLNGPSTLSLVNDSTLAGLIFNNIGATANGTGSANLNPTVNTFIAGMGTTGTGTLTIGASGIIANSSNVATTAIIQGRVDTGTGLTITTNRINVNGADVAPLQPTLAIQGLSGSGVITKAGAGVLQLNAQSYNTGAINVTAGGIGFGTLSLNGLNPSNEAGPAYATINLSAGTFLNMTNTDATIGGLAGAGAVINITTTGTIPSARTLNFGANNLSTTFIGTFSRYNDAFLFSNQFNKIGTGTFTFTGTGNTIGASATQGMQVSQGTWVYSGAGATTFSNTIVLPTATLTLDNSGTNVNNRLGGTIQLGTTATATILAVNGGTFRILGNATAATSESIGNFTISSGGGVTNPNGRALVSLEPNAAQSLTFTVGTTFGPITLGSTGLFRGLSSTVGAGLANFVLTPAIGSATGSGTGANGTFTMAIRPDILGDSSPTGLGTGFIVKDSVTGFLRPIASAEQNPLVYTGLTNTTVNYGLATANPLYGATTVLGSLAVGTGGSFTTPSGVSTAQLDGLSMQLTVNTGGVLVQSAQSALGVGRITTNNNLPLFMHTQANTTLNSVIFGTTGGLTKDGAGTLTLAARNLYLGQTNLNEGTLVLAGGDNTLPVLQTAGAPTLQSVGIHGGTLDLNGNNQAIATFFNNSSARYAGNAGIVTNSSATAATLTTSTAAFTIAVSMTGNLNFNKVGGNALTLTSPSTYSGTTTVRSGSLTLLDSATLANTTAINVNFGTLTIDQSGLNPIGNLNPQRTPSALPITLRGGTYSMTSGGSGNFSQTLNTVNASQGHSTISVPQAPIGSIGSVNIGNLVVDPDATINLTGGGGGFFSNLPGLNQSQLFINQINGTAIPPTIPGKILGGNFLANNGEFVTYVQAGTTGSNNINYGVVTLNGTTGPLGQITQTAYDTAVITAAGTAATNVRATATATLVAGGTTFNSLIFRNGAAITITFANSSNVLTLASGGLGFTNGQIVNFGSASGNGVVTSSYIPPSQTTARLYVHSQGAASVMNAVIADNGGTPVRLVANVISSSLTLTAANTYTGGTVINGGGTLAVSATGFIPAGGITINGATLTQTTSANGTTGLAPTNDVTINGSGVVTLGAFSNTLNSITFNNIGGATNPTVTIGTVGLTLTAANAITATNDTLTTVPTVAGTALLLPAAATITTQSTANVPNGLVISAPITSVATALTKAGTGSLLLSGASTYSGGMNMSAGAIILGANSTPTTGTVTSGPLGTGVLTMAGGTALLSDTTVRTVANAVTINGDVTFGASAATAFASTVAGNGVTLNGPVALGTGVARTINVNSYLNTTTFGGVVSGTGSSIIKTGPGVLVLTGANTYDGGTTINGGTVQSNATGLGTTGTITFGGGILQHAAATTTDFSSRFSTASNQPFYIDTNAQTITYATALTSTTGGSLGKFGTGTLILADAPQTPGVILINAGTLQIGNGGSSTGTLLATYGNVFDAGIFLLNRLPTDIMTTGTITGGGGITIDQGTLAPTGTVNLGGNLLFGSAAGTTTVGTLDLTNAGTNSIFAGTLSVQSNSATANSIIVPTGKTLTINGNVTIGPAAPPAANTISKLTASGGGALNVTTAAGGLFQVGGSNTGTTGGNSDTVTLDLTALGTVTVNVSATGTIRVNNPQAGNTTGAQSTLLLPIVGVPNTTPVTTFTAGNFNIGDNGGFNSQPTQINSVVLGTGLTTLNVNTINVGTGSRDIGSLTFAGTNGALIVRAADGVSRAVFNVGTGGSTAAETGANNLINLSGHNADLLLTSLNVGNQARVGNLTSTFSFDTGTLDATAVTVGFRTGTATTTSVLSNFVNIGGGTVTIGTGGLDMGNSSYNQTDAAVLNGTFNVTGGTVTIANSPTLGGAVRLVTNSGGATNGANITATLSVTGGTVTLGGNIIKGAVTGVGTANAVVTLDGGTLNMAANSIGTLANPVTFNALSGTLQELTELNGGGTLTKSGLFTLTMIGTNAYTGATTVTGGELRVNGTNTGNGAFTVQTGSVLAGTGSLAGPVTVQSGGTIRGGVDTGTGTLTTANINVQSSGILSANIGATNVASRLALGAGTLDFATGGTTPVFSFTNVTGFNPTVSATYTIATTTAGTLSVGGVQVTNNFVFGTYIQGTGTGVGDAVTLTPSLGITSQLQTGDTFTLSRTNNDLVLNFVPAVIPEPATILGLAAAGLGLAGWVRRRRKIVASSILHASR